MIGKNLNFYYQRINILIFTITFIFIFLISFILVQFYNAPFNEYQAKLVLKPLAHDKRWKFIYEPFQQDVRVLSKKIPLTKFLNLQVG